MNTITFDDTKLQTLDRRVGIDNLYLGKDQFEKSLNSWDGIPIIYNKSGEHPSDFKGISENPAKAAEKVGGKLVGFVRKPRIEIEGGPRFMASLEINEDEQEIYKLWESGKLVPSTAFLAHTDRENNLNSAPIPNHVLIFPEVKDKVLPGDQGAYIHSVVVDTSEDNPMADEEIKAENTAKKKSCHSFYEKIVEALRNVFDDEGNIKTANSVTAEESKSDVVDNAVEPVAESKPVENSKKSEEAKTESVKVEEAKTEKETTANSEKEAKMADEKDMQIDELKNKNAELQAKVSELEAKIAKQEKDEKDQKFSQFLHSFVPEGMKATDEQRKELREKYDKDVVSLMFSIKTETEKAGSGETKRVGEEYSEVKNSVQTNTTVGDLCLRNFKDED